MSDGNSEATVRRITVLVLAGAFTVGAAFHWIDIYQAGFLPYKFVPLSINIFWSMLAVVDLLTAYLLVFYRKLGVTLALAIMVMDVAVNSYAAYGLDLFPAFWPLQLQTLFLGFLLGSAGFLRPDRTVTTNKSIHGGP